MFVALTAVREVHGHGQFHRITAGRANKLGLDKGGLGLLDQSLPPPCIEQAGRNLEAARNFGNHRARREGGPPVSARDLPTTIADAALDPSAKLHVP